MRGSDILHLRLEVGAFRRIPPTAITTNENGGCEKEKLQVSICKTADFPCYDSVKRPCEEVGNCIRGFARADPGPGGALGGHRSFNWSHHDLDPFRPESGDEWFGRETVSDDRVDQAEIGEEEG